MENTKIEVLEQDEVAVQAEQAHEDALVLAIAGATSNKEWQE